MAIPKIRDSLVEETEDEQAPELAAKQNATDFAKKKKEQNSAMAKANKSALKEIISNKLAAKRKQDSSEDSTEKKLRLEVAKLKKENQILRDLNRRLQEEVLNKIPKECTVES
ncbi:uncharacterized protein LOC121420678 [Lytechinus variegatus]|uniref:uncharacterized protein LOC121420678 n=1 Tax=Lytechinus variegatus TaxID=7654 RepID=UPI001BB18B31|nr:uncharacterized protein LOC121420678 [Lytechinus variegatus]